MSSLQTYIALRVTTATGQIIKGSPGLLKSVSVNKALTGTVTIKDGSNTIAVLTNGTTAPLGVVLTGPIAFQNLTTSLTTAAEDITFVYS